MSNLWGKSQAQRDADRQQVLFEREEIARRDQEVRDRRIAQMIHDQGIISDQRIMTPAELGARYALPRNFHFGTDIPAPTWREIEEVRAKTGRDDAGHSGKIVVAALVSLPVLLGLALLYLILT
jgi:hypothetical protein